MGAPFTVDSTNYKQLDKMEELRLAYSERLFAATGSYAKFVSFDAYSGLGYWAEGTGGSSDTMQNTSEPDGPAVGDGKFAGLQKAFTTEGSDGWPAMVPPSILYYYMAEWDGASSPYDYSGSFALNYGEADEPFVSFCENAGGELFSPGGYGFRRATSLGPMGVLNTESGFGTSASYGDYLGPHIFEDIVAAFENMRTIPIIGCSNKGEVMVS